MLKLFDSLTHIHKDGTWPYKNHDASLGRLLSLFSDQYTKSLLVSLSDDNNAYTLKTAHYYPHYFIPIAYLKIDSNDTYESLKNKIAGIKESGFRGIKIHPRFSNLSLSDIKVKNAIDIAGKLNLVSMLCTIHGYPLPPLGRPIHDVLYEICFSNQDSKIILVHGGYFDLLATSELVRPMENVTIDLSLTISRFKNTSVISDIAYLFNTFDKRLCIGSDFPEFTIFDVVEVINKFVLDKNEIEFQKLENIFYKNLNKLFEDCNG